MLMKKFIALCALFALLCAGVGAQTLTLKKGDHVALIGNGAPRLVLFGPIANEKLSDPNMPDPKANNENLREYSAVMAEVAKANQVPFVDLFSRSQELYALAAKRGQSLTFNSFLLTEA